MAMFGKFKVEQKGDAAIKSALDGKKLFGKKKRLRVSVYKTRHGKQSEYSHFRGSNYELAEIMIKGKYKGGVKRPFTYNAMEKMKSDKAFLKDFKRFVFIDKGEKKVKIDWDAAALMTKVYVRVSLARDELGLAKVSPATEARKEKAGHSGTAPLFASGKLCDAITCKAEGM
jgi:hypothetical protein